MTSTAATILGSGTCVPSLKRSACAVLLEVETAKLLFDFGPGTMHRLLSAGVEIFDIDFIFLSHFHPDHTAELVPFIFATKYPDSERRKSPVTIFAGKGFHTFFKGLQDVYGDWIALPDGLLNIVEISDITQPKLALDAFSLETQPMMHREESLGYRVTNADGKSMVYSGDTDATENLVRLSREVDLLICESAMPDALKVPGHLTPSLAGEMATRAGVKKLVLTHLYPECDQVDLIAECRKTYHGPLLIAEDLMRIDF